MTTPTYIMATPQNIGAEYGNGGYFFIAGDHIRERIAEAVSAVNDARRAAASAEESLVAVKSLLPVADGGDA